MLLKSRQCLQGIIENWSFQCVFQKGENERHYGKLNN